MQFVCDASLGRTWFLIETQAEADAESEMMGHAVARYFARGIERARWSYKPRAGLASFERDIGLRDHIAREAPRFMTLRDREGGGIATAMIFSASSDGSLIEAIIVGPSNSDPYPEHEDAIAVLGAHFGVELPRDECYPYR